ncbi:MAG: hypothetical protein KJN77_05535 [Gammaproteobacteria bacterium]|nr:hypothetical protein [Gammaproteobacteria bacterium]
MPNVLRLRKRHGGGIRQAATPADGEQLVQAQSPTRALLAGLVAVVIFCVLWVALTALLDRVFPWLTVVLGAMVGFAVQRAGRGVDWRYPLLAATLALSGALLANIVVAASTTADIFDTGTLRILGAVTSMTWPVFFDEVFNAADGFYASIAAALAAFLANRRLSRNQYYALRLWKQRSDGHE